MWQLVKDVLDSIFRPTISPDLSKRERWERRAEGPLLLLSVIFLLLYAWSSLGTAGSTLTRIADAGMWLVWACFAIDYFVRLGLAEERGSWFIRHLHELALVVLPMFRPLRILRVVSVLVLAQRFSASSVRVTVAMYTVASTVLLLLVGSLTIYSAERSDPASDVNSFWDALWWSIVTVTTVGYGDIAPVTSEGRVTAALLMISGIALVGIVTATVASWLVQQVSNGDDAARDAEMLQEIRALRDEVQQLRDEVHGAGDNSGDNTDPDEHRAEHKPGQLD
ncbi:potassium channel family protein [Corynebacterium sp. TAE3-ERU12]|nr:potassium channel family protein [Corynebacterium sp. TAE3-ERU12]